MAEYKFKRLIDRALFASGDIYKSLGMIRALDGDNIQEQLGRLSSEELVQVNASCHHVRDYYDLMKSAVGDAWRARQVSRALVIEEAVHKIFQARYLV